MVKTGFESCFVQESVSWLTRTSQDIFVSHNATTNFYRKTSQCFSLHKLVDPDDIIPIPFFNVTTKSPNPK
jgi:hypothetical protein